MYNNLMLALTSNEELKMESIQIGMQLVLNVDLHSPALEGYRAGNVVEVDREPDSTGIFVKATTGENTNSWIPEFVSSEALPNTLSPQ